MHLGSIFLRSDIFTLCILKSGDILLNLKAYCGYQKLAQSAGIHLKDPFQILKATVLMLCDLCLICQHLSSSP